MPTAQVGYEPVYRWVKPILGRTHTTVVVTVVWAVMHCFFKLIFVPLC